MHKILELLKIHIKINSKITHTHILSM